MKLLTIIILFTFLFPQENIRLTNLESAKKLALKSLVLAWEIDTTHGFSSRFTFGKYQKNNSAKLFNFSKITYSPNHTILLCSFNSYGEILYSIISPPKDLTIHSDKEIVWLGLSKKEESYNFTKWLIEKVAEPSRIYSLLNIHGFHERTFQYFRSRYAKISSAKEKRKLIFWIASIPTKKAILFLDQNYIETNSKKSKENIIFAFSQSSNTLAIKRLIFIAKHDQYIAMRKKAIFCLGQKAGNHIESLFSDIVFSNDEFEIKNSAIFALYNMKNKETLKKIIMAAKDIRLRKKALFWLGQMGISVEYLEKILNHN